MTANRHTATTRVLLAFFTSLATLLRAADLFTIVAMPDTQNYSKSYPDTYFSQTEWVVAQRSALNVLFLTHLGDITNNQDDTDQWENADAAMQVLDDSGLPYGCCPGNHDFHYGNGESVATYEAPEYDALGINYRAKFGPQRFAGKSWYGGCSSSQLSNYQIIEYDTGKQMLFLHLCVETPPAELAWAQEVLNAHRDLPVWVSTHRYMQNAEQFAGSLGAPLGILAGRYPQIWYDTAEPVYRSDGITGDEFFNLFVRINKNIFMVHCGHFHGWYNQTTANNWGLPVHEILTDYQDADNGGDGWLRYYTFAKQSDGSYLVTAKTYSTTRQEFGSPSGALGDFPSQFTFSINLSDYVYSDNELALQLRQGTNGYTGATDTWIGANSASASHGSDTSLEVDDDTENGIDFGDEPAAQALIRFDGLFCSPIKEGDPAPTRIPTDATVSTSDLTFYVTDDVDADVVGNMPDDAFRVFMLNAAFTGASTWNSVGGGMYGSRVGSQIAVFDPDNVPDGSEARTIDATAAVEAWRTGTSNYGLLLTTWPRNLDWFDDGITIASSESSEYLKRPCLTIDCTYPVNNVAPTVTLPLQVAATTVDEGSSLRIRIGASDPNPADSLIVRINGSGCGTIAGSGTNEFDLVFADNGVYTCTATVEDDEATVAAGSATITVRNVPPSFVLAPTDTILPDTNPVFAFTASAQDPGTEDVLTYAWDFNADGTFETLGNAVSYRFSTVGAHRVALRVSDDDGGSITTNFAVTVEVGASEPYADAYQTSEDLALSVSAPGVLANDRLRDGATPVVVTAPAHGSLVLSDTGAFVYVPVTNWYGTDTFTYALSEADAQSATANVTIRVTSVADAPMGLADCYYVAANGALSVLAPGVLANDGDADGDSLQAYLMRGPDCGDMTLEPDGSFAYTPFVGFVGSDSFDYLVMDDGGRLGNLVTATITVVNPVPLPGQTLTNMQARVATTFHATLPSAAFTDAFDEDLLVWSLAPSDGGALPAWLTFTSATHTLSGTPSVSDLGTLSLSAKVTDSDGATATQTFTLTVSASGTVTKTNYERWAEDNLSAWNSGSRGFDADADGDGLANGFDYTFGDTLSTQALLSIHWETDHLWLTTPPALGDRTNDVDVWIKATHRLGDGADWSVPVLGPTPTNGVWQWHLQDPATSAFFRMNLRLKRDESN